jgi:hypothetical protein
MGAGQQPKIPHLARKPLGSLDAGGGVNPPKIVPSSGSAGKALVSAGTPSFAEVCWSPLPSVLINLCDGSAEAPIVENEQDASKTSVLIAMLRRLRFGLPGDSQFLSPELPNRVVLSLDMRIFSFLKFPVCLGRSRRDGTH